MRITKILRTIGETAALAPVKMKSRPHVCYQPKLPKALKEKMD